MYLQPASVNEWYPGWQRSHLSPMTPGLQLQRPVLSHCVLREPGEGKKTNTNLLGEKKKNQSYTFTPLTLPHTHTLSCAVTHQQGYSCRAGSDGLDPLCSSYPGSARSWVRLCCQHSCGNDLRDPWHGTDPGRSSIHCFCHCSCKLKHTFTFPINTKIIMITEIAEVTLISSFYTLFKKNICQVSVNE